METVGYIYDVYFKDEGDFVSVCFLTPNSKELIKKEFSGGNADALYGDEILKFDIHPKSVNSMVSWCISHSLTFESDIDIIL